MVRLTTARLIPFRRWFTGEIQTPHPFTFSSGTAWGNMTADIRRRKHRNGPGWNGYRCNVLARAVPAKHLGAGQYQDVPVSRSMDPITVQINLRWACSVLIWMAQVSVTSAIRGVVVGNYVSVAPPAAALRPQTVGW